MDPAASLVQALIAEGIGPALLISLLVNVAQFGLFREQMKARESDRERMNQIAEKVGAALANFGELLTQLRIEVGSHRQGERR